jgi:hypothetical protein
MGHLKIKCVDLRVTVHNLASTSVPFMYTHNGAKFSTNSQEMNNSVRVC